MENIFTSIKKNALKFRQKRGDQPKISRAERRKAIAELRSLSDSQLKDMGISRSSIIHSVAHGRATDNAA